MAGFGIDITAWTDDVPLPADKGVYLRMKLYTPIMAADKVVQLFASLKKSGDTASYDTVLCSKQWMGIDLEPYFGYEVHDMSHGVDLYSDGKEGTHLTSIEAYYDTALGGTEDWTID